MNWNNNPSFIFKSTIPVLPTETELFSLRINERNKFVMQVTNNDASQTLNCTLQRRLDSDAPFVPTDFAPAINSIEPLASAIVEFEIAYNYEIRLVGLMSGAGGSASVIVRG